CHAHIIHTRAERERAAQPKATRRWRVYRPAPAPTPSSESPSTSNAPLGPRSALPLDVVPHCQLPLTLRLSFRSDPADSLPLFPVAWRSPPSPPPSRTPASRERLPEQNNVEGG